MREPLATAAAGPAAAEPVAAPATAALAASELAVAEPAAAELAAAVELATEPVEAAAVGLVKHVAAEDPADVPAAVAAASVSVLLARRAYEKKP